MAKLLDMNNWPRRDHYEFFKGFENPYFTVGAEQDVTLLVEYCRNQNLSFFLANLFLSVKAANQIPEFHYRINNDRIEVHEKVHASSTYLNEENNFGFCHFDYESQFSSFYQCATQQLELKKKQTLDLLKELPRQDVIYYSCLPWIHFKSFQHPVPAGDKGSIPKIMFGKYSATKHEEVIKMPLSVSVNHAVMDGYHVGQYFQAYQQLLDAPEKHLLQTI